MHAGARVVAVSKARRQVHAVGISVRVLVLAGEVQQTVAIVVATVAPLVRSGMNVATGVVAPSLPLGAYAWIVTLTQEGSGSTVHLPYCAPQTAPHPDAYDIAVTHEGGEVTFTPDYTDLFGDDPPREVIVQVARPCEFMSCFFAYYASLSAVGLTGVSAAPVSSLEGGGFEHGVDVSVDELPDEFLDRFHVIQTRWDYCLSGSDSAPQVAQDEHFALCGSEALAQEHGDDSNLEYDLIVRPL